MVGETFEVRIPQHFVESLHTGDITPSMLLTLLLLHNWANWKTGVVRRASAAGLASWSGKAYHPNTFSEALRRLELMGHITRKMARGSHKDYPIVIHNYKVYDAVGKPSMINPKVTRTWAEIQGGQCDEGLDETVDETLYETVDETVDKVLSLNVSQLESENESTNEVGRLVGREAKFQSKAPTGELPEIEAEIVSRGEVPATQPLPPAIPEIPVRETSPALALTEKFFAYQGSPAKLHKSVMDWTRRVEVLLGLYPNLGDIMTYAFETNEFWSQKLIRPVSDPLTYFELKLSVSEDEKGSIRNQFMDYQARKAAAKAKAMAASAGAACGTEELWPYEKIINGRGLEHTKQHLARNLERYQADHPEWVADFKERKII